MERLTRPNINVDPGTDRFLHAAIGGKKIDWKQSRDSTLNVLINGPTSNGFGKDIFRKMVRDLYGRLKAYEDSGCEPEEVLPKGKAGEIALNLMRLAGLESLCSYDRLRELAEADKDGRLLVLPCKPDGSMLDTSDPERPEIMKRIHFAVAYVCGGIVFHQPYSIFLENVAAGYIRPLNEEAEKALEVE